MSDWEHKTGERHPVLRELDLALAQAMAEEWSGIEITVKWPRYTAILKWRAPHLRMAYAACKADLERRPLKAYRGFSLRLILDDREQERVSGWQGLTLKTVALTA